MERISANGETYVKASSIARELGYTADYVGQLCRSGQVDAQLVGRSWFVNENSIRTHKRNRYRSTSAKSKEAVREELAARTTRTPMNVRAHFQSISQPQSLRYEADEEAVLPNIAPRNTVASPTNSEGIVPIRRVETLELVPSDQKTGPVEEKIVEVVSDESRVVPIRRGSALTIRARKLREEALRHQPVLQGDQVAIPVTNIEETFTESAHEATGTGQWALIGISFATAAAFIASVSLVGFESHSIADSTGSYTAYQLNFASAIEAWK